MQYTREQAEARLSQLDLGPIKFKIMDKKEGLGWGRELVESVESGYRQFLTLNMMYPNRSIVPSKQIDRFWHYHILDTMKYAEDCEQVIGRFLHHFPYLGMRGEKDSRLLQDTFVETKNLFMKVFGNEAFLTVNESMCSNCEPADGPPGCQPSLQPSICGANQCDAPQCNPDTYQQDFARPTVQPLTSPTTLPA